MKLLPDFTPWEVLEIYSNESGIYCLQVRVHKRTGTKNFKTCKIAETDSPINLKNVTIERINCLTKIKEESSSQKQVQNMTA